MLGVYNIFFPFSYTRDDFSQKFSIRHLFTLFIHFVNHISYVTGVCDELQKNKKRN